MDRERLAAALVVAFFVMFAAITASQRYTVPDPWKPYVNAVREYMAAGVRGDSAVLAGRSAGSQPLAWVRDAVHRRPALIAEWAQELQHGKGERRGDTVVMVLWASDVEGCSRLNSVSALLLDHSSSPRILSISSPCLDRSPLPAFPW